MRVLEYVCPIFFYFFLVITSPPSGYIKVTDYSSLNTISDRPMCLDGNINWALRKPELERCIFQGASQLMSEDAIIDWFKNQGVRSVIAADDFHKFGERAPERVRVVSGVKGRRTFWSAFCAWTGQLRCSVLSVSIIIDLDMKPVRVAVVPQTL
jgi:hypothetical protein